MICESIEIKNMSKISSFEDLRIWQEAIQTSIELYQSFKDCKDFSFKDQILRASVSVPSNIAEGFERNNDKEFRNFLRYSKGSAGEIRTQLVLAKAVGLIEANKADDLRKRLVALSKQIQSLMTKIDQKLGK